MQKAGRQSRKKAAGRSSLLPHRHGGLWRASKGKTDPLAPGTALLCFSTALLAVRWGGEKGGGSLAKPALLYQGLGTYPSPHQPVLPKGVRGVSQDCSTSTQTKPPQGVLYLLSQTAQGESLLAATLSRESAPLTLMGLTSEQAGIA